MMMMTDYDFVVHCILETDIEGKVLMKIKERKNNDRLILRVKPNVLYVKSMSIPNTVFIKSYEFVQMQLTSQQADMSEDAI